jgi:hypothetical protein
MARKLVAVTDETPPPAPKRTLTVQAAAATGDQRELLVAMRTRIAEAVGDPNTPARDLAALSRRLLEIAKDLKALDASEESDDIGQAAATPDEKWVAN